MNSERYNAKISEAINKLMDLENYEKIISILKQKLRKERDSYWILTTIAISYCELRKYDTAFKYSIRAMKLENKDPLVIHYHASICSMIGKAKQSCRLWEKILGMGVNHLAYGIHGEGMRWALSLENDIHYNLALNYFELGNINKARYYISKHLKNRKRGKHSNYPKSLVLKKYVEIMKKTIPKK